MVAVLSSVYVLPTFPVQQMTVLICLNTEYYNAEEKQMQKTHFSSASSLKFDLCIICSVHFPTGNNFSMMDAQVYTTFVCNEKYTVEEDYRNIFSE